MKRRAIGLIALIYLGGAAFSIYRQKTYGDQNVPLGSQLYMAAVWPLGLLGLGTFSSANTFPSAG